MTTVERAPLSSAKSVLEATIRNVEACREISSIARTSLGPNGKNKLVVNHICKIIVTSDCATIVNELEIEHPAAKMVALAAEAQDFECGDGTNLVVTFCGELLSQSEDFFWMGLCPSDVISGYGRAAEKLIWFLDGLVGEVKGVGDVRDKHESERVLRPVLAAKHLGSEHIMAPLLADACLGTMSASGPPSVNVKSVQVVKILGWDVSQSHIVHGFVAL